MKSPESGFEKKKERLCSVVYFRGTNASWHPGRLGRRFGGEVLVNHDQLFIAKSKISDGNQENSEEISWHVPSSILDVR